MTLKNSSLLLLLITSWVWVDCLAKFSWGKEPFVDQCEKFRPKPHAFLCDEKIALPQANPFDLALVDGVSLTLARKIVAFMAENPRAEIQDINDVKGVGDKTLAKIQTYFF